MKQHISQFQCITEQVILDFNLSPCFICNAFSFGYLPGVRVLKADVSKLSAGSIFIGRSMKCVCLWRWNRQRVPKRRLLALGRRGDTQNKTHYRTSNVYLLHIGYIRMWAGERSRYKDWLRAWRSGDRIPVGGEIFRTCPDRSWGPPTHLYSGYRFFPVGKERPGRDAEPSPPSSAVGHERVELYLYSPYGLYGLYRASVLVQGWPLHFLFILIFSKPRRKGFASTTVRPPAVIFFWTEA